MLSIAHPSAPLCDGLTRREWLTVGGLGAFGLTLPGLLHARESLPAPAKKAKSVILLFLLGAPPQQETWDPKPDSPAEFRGDLKAMPSATPGLLVGETMVQTAKRTNRIAVLRAVQTRDNAHSSSGYTMTTGVAHAPVSAENVKPGAPNDWPSVGAVARKFLQHRTSLPAAVTLPEQAENDGKITWPGQDAGFLGRAHDPWLLETDPSKPDFGIPGLSLPAELPRGRFDSRLSLREQIDVRFARYEATSAETPHTARTRKAVDMIASPTARAAFNLNAENPKLRDRYGRTRFGQSCLLARRLVEAGVPLVRVNWTRLEGAPNSGHWDTHQKNSEGVKTLMPVLDAAYSTLLDDLADRGMLDDTLVIWMAEFGRTPKINPAAGRDHWGQVFSIALAGGGVRGGTVYGASDAQAAYPRDGIVTPQDFTATVFDALGLPADTEMRDTLDRPIPISRGRVIREVF